MRQIKVDDSVTHMRHCVQLNSGQFVFCGEFTQQAQREQYTVRHHKVCLVDDSGRVIKSYDGKRGEAIRQMYKPSCLAVDSHDNILVADFWNNRLVLLNSQLEHLTTITTVNQSSDAGELKLRCPTRLHLDAQNRRLFIVHYYTPTESQALVLLL